MVHFPFYRKSRIMKPIKVLELSEVDRRTRQTLWGGCADANPKLLPNDT